MVVNQKKKSKKHVSTENGSIKVSTNHVKKQYLWISILTLLEEAFLGQVMVFESCNVEFQSLFLISVSHQFHLVSILDLLNVSHDLLMFSWHCKNFSSVA